MKMLGAAIFALISAAVFSAAPFEAAGEAPSLKDQLVGT